MLKPSPKLNYKDCRTKSVHKLNQISFWWVNIELSEHNIIQRIGNSEAMKLITVYTFEHIQPALASTKWFMSVILNQYQKCEVHINLQNKWVPTNFVYLLFINWYMCPNGQNVYKILILIRNIWITIIYIGANGTSISLILSLSYY